MARKRKSSRTAFRTVVQVPLLPEHELLIESYAADLGRIWDVVKALILAGHKLAITWSDEYGMYSASLFCENEDSPNAGDMLFGNADTVEAALAVVLFKSEVISNGGKWAGESGTSRSKYS